MCAANAEVMSNSDLVNVLAESRIALYSDPGIVERILAVTGIATETAVKSDLQRRAHAAHVILSAGPGAARPDVVTTEVTA
jgi:hypothetical protein